MARYAIVTDLNRCVGCLACVVACKGANAVPIGSFWNKVLRIGPTPKKDGEGYPNVEMYYLPVQCQHCENPECVKVGPTGASYKAADGTVQIDKEKCIGCQFCAMSCPYGVRYLNEEERVVEKCTLCEQKISQGELPQCVAQCGAHARFFGDLDAGLDSFEGPLNYKITEDYEGLTYAEAAQNRSTWGTYEGIKPYTEEEVHHLPDVGNSPSLMYVLRNVEWKE